jgi:hypothetical protein
LNGRYGLGCGYGLNCSTVTGNAGGFLTEPPPEVLPRNVVRRRRSHTDVEIRLAISYGGEDNNSGSIIGGGEGGGITAVRFASGGGSGSDSGYGIASSSCSGMEAAGMWKSWRTYETKSNRKKSWVTGDGEAQTKRPASISAARCKFGEGA